MALGKYPMKKTFQISKFELEIGPNSEFGSLLERSTQLYD